MLGEKLKSLINCRLPHVNEKKHPFDLSLSFRLLIRIFLFTTVVAIFFRCTSANDKLSVDIVEKRIAVLIFENLTQDETLEDVGKMAADWIAQGLMQIDDVTVLTPATIRELDESFGDDLLTYLANNTKVDYAFTGNYYLDGGDIIIKARLVNVKNNVVEYYLPDYSSHKIAPLEAVKELTERIMGYWLNKKQIEARITHPPKYEAYKAFLKGMKYYEVDNVPFRNYMEKALLHDADYFEPHLFLAYSYYYNNYNDDRSANIADSIIQVVYEKGLQLTDYQEAVLKAAESEIKSDTDKAFRYYLELFNKYPDDGFVRYNAGTFALFSNHISKAIEIYEGADFENMDFSINVEKRNLLFLFDALHQNGNFQEILDLSEKYLKENPDYFYLIIAHINLGNEAAAEKEFNRLNQTKDDDLRRPKSYYYNIIGQEYIKLNNPNRAKLCLQKSMEYAPNRKGEINYERLFALFYLKEYQKGISELEKLLEYFPEHEQSLSRGTVVNFLAYYHAAAGNIDLARQYQEQRNGMPTQHFFFLTDAFISMKSGDKKGAVEDLRKAYRAGVVFEDISFGQNVDFLPLRGFEPFDEFIRPR